MPPPGANDQGVTGASSRMGCKLGAMQRERETRPMPDHSRPPVCGGGSQIPLNPRFPWSARPARTFRIASLRLAAAVLACAITIGGCGSGAASGTRHRASRPAFTLGMICSCSGPESSSAGDNGSAIRAWADWVDAHGGINGYAVHVIVSNDMENPAASLQDARALVTEDHIVALIGDSSFVDAVWAKYMRQAGVPVVGGIPQEAPFLTNPDFFPSGSQLSQIAGIVQLADSVGKRHLGLYYCAEAPICAQSIPPAQAAAHQFGSRFSAGAISATQPSYAAPCLSAKAAGVNALWVADTSPIVQRFAASCVQQGYGPLQIGELGSATTAWLHDPNLNGMLLTANDADAYDTHLPALHDFYAALRQYAPALLTSSSSVSEPNTLFAWTGGLLFQAAARAAHLTPASTPQAVKRGLYMLRNETLGGIAPPLSFAPGPPAFVRCYFTDRLSGGTIVALNGARPSCLTAAQAAAVATAAER